MSAVIDVSSKPSSLKPASATPLLDTLLEPADLRNLPQSSLAQVAAELRTEMIDAVSVTGGHLGAGLGLAVAHRMVETMSGEIALEHSSEAGSTFVIRLPLGLAESPVVALRGDDEGACPSPHEAGSAARILVVDDHPTNREIARLMLAPLGCEIFEAADGIEAVEMASNARFDLILMDVRMPRMDGLAATRAIRALPEPFGRTPILAITADAMPEDAARCLGAGMDGHLAKPITHASLFAAIDAVMSATSDAQATLAA